MLSLDKTIESLLCFLCLFIPLYVVGFRLFGYDMSFAMLILIVLNIALLIKNKFNKYIISSFFLFISWCFITALPRHEISSYISSLAALWLVCFPLSASWKNIKINRKKIYQYYLYGIYITLGIVIYEIICILFNVQPFYNNISFGIFERIRVAQFLGINRIKGLFLEPAHLAIYSVFSFVVLDTFESNSGTKNWLKMALFIVVLLTFSLTGLIIISAYYFSKYILFNNNRFKHTLKSVSIAMLALTVLVYFFSDYFFLIVNRFEAMLRVLETGAFSRTYGARANAIFVLGDYYESEGFWGFLIGEGYANYENWLIQNFGHLELSSLAHGNIPNVLSALALSTGLIGMVLYIVFLVTTVKQFKVANRKTFFVLIFVLNFGMGFLISYIMWALILILLVLNQR